MQWRLRFGGSILNHGIANHAERLVCVETEFLKLLEDWQANGADWCILGKDAITKPHIKMLEPWQRVDALEKSFAIAVHIFGQLLVGPFLDAYLQ